MTDNTFKIGFDIDGVLNNLTEAVLEVYNMDSGDNLTVDDIKSYHIEDYVKPEYKEGWAEKYFSDKRVWKRVKPNFEMVEVIKRLLVEGIKIYFITASSSYNFHKKEAWLKRLFSEINMDEALIRCVNKQLIGGVDVLVDDCAANLIGGSYKGILVDRPWNREMEYEITINDIARCETTQQIYDAIVHCISYSIYPKGF